MALGQEIKRKLLVYSVVGPRISLHKRDGADGGTEVGRVAIYFTGFVKKSREFVAVVKDSHTANNTRFVCPQFFEQQINGSGRHGGSRGVRCV